MRKCFRHLFSLSLLLVVFSGNPLSSQTADKVYEPFVPTQQYQQAFNLVQQGGLEQGIQLFGQIAAQNPGTTLGAVSLMRQAYYTTPDSDSIPIYQAVSSGYP